MNMREVTEAVLAILVVGGVVTIAGAEALNGKPVTIPAELWGFGGIIVGAYFRGSNQINGVATKLITALKESGPPPTTVAVITPPPAPGG
jgi:hypothetical protein